MMLFSVVSVAFCWFRVYPMVEMPMAARVEMRISPLVATLAVRADR